MTDPTSPVWEICTRPHSICCVATQHPSHRGCRVKICLPKYYNNC